MTADIRKAFGEKNELECPHPRLLLETSSKGYLTGAYVCEQCGQKFEKPAKQPDTSA